MPNSKNNNGIRKPAYVGVYVEDGGFCVAVKSSGKISAECVKTEKNNVDKKIFSWLYKYPLKHKVKVIGTGIILNGDKDRERKLATDIWLKEDIVPFLLKINNGSGYEKAKKAAEEAAKRFKDDYLVDIKFDTKRKVVVEELARLEDFRKTVSEEEFGLLLDLAKRFKKQKGKLVFFSSTPRGGGVALMRHALIRFFRLLGVNAQWYVMISKEEIFNITKKKFHNVLQNVAPPGTKLTNQDKKLFREWTKKNADRFADIFKKAKVIVIDDPQPSGLVPYIRKANPRAKVIYRSHIQIESDLAAKEGTPQNITWNFIWNNIKSADLFVSHPVKKFIPHNVPREKTVLMGAATDDLDGLNKELAKRHMQYYFDLFNEILKENGQAPLNLKRPYIVQIARFDPSKGIPDVIESYRKLRKKIEEKGWPKSAVPQLVIAGHGAVDDPEGAPIYKETMNMLEMDDYKNYAKDIKVARLPDSDQILNTLMRGSFMALQLSHKEGFEIKVAEALEKGKPVIAYKTGGIPIQVKHKVNGYLVKVGDTGKVADLLYKLLSDKEKYSKLSRNAKDKVERDFFTVSNAIKWLFLAIELMERGELKGNRRRVRDIIEKQKKVQLRKYLPMWFAELFRK
jgi:glycosyltransferase involved in cell wall biosynthesis